MIISPDEPRAAGINTVRITINTYNFRVNQGVGIAEYNIENGFRGWTGTLAFRRGSLGANPAIHNLILHSTGGLQGLKIHLDIVSDAPDSVEQQPECPDELEGYPYVGLAIWEEATILDHTGN